MTEKEFEVGDLVWAQMKGFCFWPGHVAEPPPELKNSVFKKSHHCIFFYGTDNYAWIPDEKIKHHTEEKAKEAMEKKLSATLRSAIERIEKERKEQKSEKGSVKSVTVSEKTPKTPRTSTSNSEKSSKSNKATNSSEKVVKSPVSAKKVAKASPAVKLGKSEKLAKTPKAVKSISKTSKTPSTVEKIAREAKSDRVTTSTETKKVSRKRSLDTDGIEQKLKVSRKRSLEADGVEQEVREVSHEGHGVAHKIKVSRKRSLEEDAGDEEIRIGRKRSLEDDAVEQELKVSRFEDIPTRVAIIKPNYESAATANQTTSGSLFRRNTEYFNVPQTPELDLRYLNDQIGARRITPTTRKVGFLGLGTMGSRIARNLINTGHNVTVWNRSYDKSDTFKAIGGTVAQTPSDVVESCDLIFSCVSCPKAVKDLVFGNWGVLQGFDKSDNSDFELKGYIELTSIKPETCREIAEAITQKGGRYLEAPIFGSKDLAEEGKLLILGAGDKDLFEECESIFGAITQNTYFLSSTVGSGSMMHLILSMFTGTTFAALGEAMALIRRLRLDPEQFIRVLEFSPLGCDQIIEKAKLMVSQVFLTNHSLKYQQQNMHMALRLSNIQPLAVSSTANELYKHARLLRYDEHDVAAVFFGAKY